MDGECDAALPLQDIVEPEARAAFVWILGEYGQSIQVLKHSIHVSCCLALPLLPQLICPCERPAHRQACSPAADLIGLADFINAHLQQTVSGSNT